MSDLLTLDQLPRRHFRPTTYLVHLPEPREFDGVDENGEAEWSISVTKLTIALGPSRAEIRHSHRLYRRRQLARRRRTR